MKKIKTILAAAALLLATSAFATGGGETKVSTKVKAAFVSNFAKAEQVSWTSKSDFYFAKFTLNGVTSEAAYTYDGELIATSRKVAVADLPLALSTELNNRYDGYVISAEATEINFEGTTTYYLDVQDNTHLLELKCTPDGNVDVEKKSKKAAPVVLS